MKNFALKFNPILVWTAFTAFSCLAQAQVSNRLTGKASTAKESSWAGSFELTQGIPQDSLAKDNTSYFEGNLAYNYNPVYQNTLNIAGLKNWLKENETESDKKEYLLNDVYLGLVRKDTLILTSNLGLPTSDDAQKSKRDFSISLEPMYLIDKPNYRFRIRTEFILDKNRSEVIDEGSSIKPASVEQYAAWTQVVYLFKFNSKASWFNKYSHYQSWNQDDTLTEYRTISTGPQYLFQKKYLVRVAYRTEDVPDTDKHLFDSRTNGVGITGLLVF